MVMVTVEPLVRNPRRSLGNPNGPPEGETMKTIPTTLTAMTTTRETDIAALIVVAAVAVGAEAGVLGRKRAMR